MVNLNKTLISIALLLILMPMHSSLAQKFQEGYIIQLSGDTLSKNIELRSEELNFQSCITGKNETLGPNDILGYGVYGSKHFVSKQDSFIEVLVVGEISLFKSSDGFVIEKNSEELLLEKEMVIVTENGRSYEKDASNWKGKLSYFISDCLDNSELQSLSLTEKSLTKKIEEYHECRGSDYRVIKGSIPWTQLNVGIGLELVSSTIFIRDTDAFFSSHEWLSDDYKSVDPGIAFNLQVRFPRISRDLGIFVEPMFVQSSFENTTEEIYPLRTNQYSSEIDLSTVILPVKLFKTWHLHSGSISPNFGPSMEINLSSSSSYEGRIQYQDSRSPELIPEDEAFIINGFHLGFEGGVLYEKELGKIRFGTSITYSFMPNLNEARSFRATINRLAFGVQLLMN